MKEKKKHTRKKKIPRIKKKNKKHRTKKKEDNPWMEQEKT